MFSKTCEYGIKAILFIASQSLAGDRISLKSIAAKIDSPEAFTAKILQQLARNKLIKSIKGPNGGFEIDRADLQTIRLIDVVRTLDGDELYTGCGLGLKECNAKKPCPLHHKFISIRNELMLMLETTNLEELSMDLDNGLSFLKR